MIINKFSTKKVMVPTRKKVIPEERAALRKARKQHAAQFMQTQQGSNTIVDGIKTGSTVASSTKVMGNISQDPRVVFGLGLGIPTFLLAWGIYDDQSPPARLAYIVGLTDQIESFADEFARPSKQKLIQDWNQLPNIPQEMPPPHTLVLDLENTLVHSTWDRKHGWRHAKRPGVDKFLTDMAQYYEIVLYSPSHEAVADPVVTSLDKNGCIMHRLFRDACYYKNGTYVKDLASLNRNIRKIILLDDDAKAAQFNPGNLLKIKPYDDPSNRQDDTLKRITPFLIEVAREGYNDIPELFRQFRGMHAGEIALEVERRVEALKSTRVRRAKHGLGFFSNSMNSNLPPPEMTPVPERNQVIGTGKGGPQGQLTSLDLVGSDPTSKEKTGFGISGWLKRRQQEQEEQQMRKMEKWNEVMMKKSMEKKQRGVKAAHAA